MGSEEAVIVLLKRYRSNVKRVEQLMNDDTIKEWQMDYRYRIGTGGVHSSHHNQVNEQRGNYSNNSSIQDRLLLERQNVFELLERMKLEVELTKLLLLQLNEDDKKLVLMRIVKKAPVSNICRTMYISKSNYYRRRKEILEKLTKCYIKIMKENTIK